MEQFEPSRVSSSGGTGGKLTPKLPPKHLTSIKLSSINYSNTQNQTTDILFLKLCIAVWRHQEISQTTHPKALLKLTCYIIRPLTCCAPPLNFVAG